MHLIKPASKFLAKILFSIIIFITTALVNGQDSSSAATVKAPTDFTNTPSTLNVLYIEPGTLQSDVYSLNEESMIGKHYKKGWILPSLQSISLNLYLYYDNDESRIRPFVKNSVFNDTQTNVAVAAAAAFANNSSVSTAQKSQAFFQALYIFFTPEKNCLDYMNRNSWPLEIVERIAPNMYRAHMSSLTLPYSSQPLHICMQQFDFDENILDSHKFFTHQGVDYWVSIVTTRSLLPIWLRICLFFVLLTLSGLFSGLNLGLMSLDVNELETLKRIGTPKEQSYAAKIYPLRKRGNFLLCTILLGNVLVNSVSTLLLGDMLSGVYAALGSTILIVIFGEIIPQAACSKHGLAVGAYTRYIMYTFMFLTSPLSFPLSIILDKVLGQEIVATYNREKLRELMMNVEDLDDKEKKIITGALDFNKKKVRAIMTKLEDVFMLEINSRLDFEAIAKIAQEGFSRIPVYQGSKENVVGLLHVKDFTLLDPDDNMPVKALLEFYNHTVITCDAEKPIDEMFEEFRKGETHLAFVTDVFTEESDKDPVQTCVGIVTLEDILEELVQMEIYDEFDDKKEIEIEESKQQQQDQLLKSNEERKSLTENKSSESKGRKRSDSTTPNNNNESNVQIIPLGYIGGAKSKASQSNTQSSDQSATAAPTREITFINNQSFDPSQSIKTAPTGGTGTTSSGSQPKSPTSTTTPHYETQVSKDFSFFLQQQKDSSQRTLISPQVRFVMFQFLFTTVKPFTTEFLTKNVFELLFKRAIIKESRHTDSKMPTEYLYRYNKGCNYFILILSGEAIIEVGQEKLEFPAGPFAYFGVNALLCGRDNVEEVLQDDSTDEFPRQRSQLYVPDFSLRVDDRCVYLKIDRDLWRNGVIKSNYERVNNHLSESIEYMPQPGAEDILSSLQDINAVTSSNTTSPHHQVLLRKFKDSTQQLQPTSLLEAPPVKTGRRSTISSAAVLNKAQEIAKSVGKISQTKLGQLESSIAEMKETNEVDEHSVLLLNSNPSMDAPLNTGCTAAEENEEMPFKRRSTLSLDINLKEIEAHKVGGGGGGGGGETGSASAVNHNKSMNKQYKSFSQKSLED